MAKTFIIEVIWPWISHTESIKIDAADSQEAVNNLKEAIARQIERAPDYKIGKIKEIKAI